MAESIFRQESLMAQRILKKEFKLNAYDASPLDIPFQGSNFQLLKVRGNTGLSTVIVTFDEETTIEMKPGEKITGFLFRKIRLQPYEDGPTHCTVFISKENNGRTPELTTDSDLFAAGKSTRVVVSRRVLLPDNWFDTFPTYAPPNVVLYDGSEEDVESVECYFDLCTAYEDPDYFAAAALAGGSGWSDTLLFSDSVTSLISTISSYNNALHYEPGVDNPNPIPERLGLRFIPGDIYGVSRFDAEGIHVPFAVPDAFVNYIAAFCCDGGKFVWHKNSPLAVFIPGKMASAMKAAKLAVRITVHTIYRG